MDATDYDVMLWHHTKIAKNQFDFLSKGYDPGDERLTSENLREKYKGDILDQKANNFSSLKIEKQKEQLLKTLTKSEKSGVIGEETARAFIVSRVWAYLGKLKALDKYDEWIERSVTFQELIRLPIKEQTKYHDALIDFYDKSMEKCDGQPSLNQVLDSSPTGKEEDCPNFDDPSKWEEV